MNAGTLVRQGKIGPETYPNRIPSLDGLRAVSIGLVFLGHLFTTTNYPNNRVTASLAQFSHFGVQVFFVISGFLITSLLLEERRSKGKVDLRAFYLRRGFRIMPPAFAYIAFATAMRFVLRRPVAPKYVAVALTYTTCYFDSGPWVLRHLWSLSVEEQFYLFWPIVLVAAFGLRRRTCWAILCVSPIARLAYQNYAPALVDYAFPAVADSLAAGCLLALYRPELQRLPKWTYTTPITLGLVIAAFASNQVYRQPVIYWGIVPLVIAAAIHNLVVRKDWLLNNRAVAYIGALSYSLYLFQQPFLTQSATTNRWSSFPINIALAVSFALMSYYLVERPMIRIGRRISTRSAITSPPVEMSFS